MPRKITAIESKCVKQFEKHNLNLAGEFRVAAELLLRGIHASVTYGNKKGADVLAVGENRRAAIIEVKSSQQNNFVTGFYQKYRVPSLSDPDFWVFYSVKTAERGFEEHFYVMNHSEVGEIQATQNWPGQQLDYASRVERARNGVDNIKLSLVSKFEGAWNKIVEFCGSGVG